MLAKKEVIKCIASFFYVGYLPASGTIASIFAVLIFFILKNNLLIYNISALLSIPLALAVSWQGERIFQEKDPHCVVIDEMAGMFVSFLFVPFKWEYVILGFILFRFFDILKVYPLKKIEKLTGGFGIVMDDICAAVYTNLILRALIKTGLF